MKKTIFALICVTSLYGSDIQQQSSYSYLLSIWRFFYVVVRTITPSFLWPKPTKKFESSKLNWSAWITQCNKMPSFPELQRQHPVKEIDSEKLEDNIKYHCDKIQEKTNLTWNFVVKIVTAYKKACDTGSLFDPNAWVEKNVFLEKFESRQKPEFKPFVVGFKVPANAQIYTFGDRHGDVLSTLKMLKKLRDDNVLDANFTINDPNTYIVGLGDYVDRGTAGIETLLTMLMLKIQNPNNVILVRGNHEDSTSDFNRCYFQKELKHKFPNNITDKSIIACIYDTMPVAAFIGCENEPKTTTSYILAAHGCVDIRDNPHTLYQALDSKKTGLFIYKQYPKITRANAGNETALNVIKQAKVNNVTTYLTSHATGHLNIDYEQALIKIDLEREPEVIDKGNKCIYSDSLVNAIFKDWEIITEKQDAKPSHTSYVHSVLRGHQHSSHDYEIFGAIMNELWTNKGCTQAWNKTQQNEGEHIMPQNSFYTILPAPNNEYGVLVKGNKYPGYSYDTWIKITPKENNSVLSWHMTRINLQTI